MKITSNIQGYKNLKNPHTIMFAIVQRVKAKRKQLHVTQEELSSLSGVSFGSIKRFETTGEISMQALLKIAIALDCETDFNALFTKE